MHLQICARIAIGEPLLPTAPVASYHKKRKEPRKHSKDTQSSSDSLKRFGFLLLEIESLYLFSRSCFLKSERLVKDNIFQRDARCIFNISALGITHRDARYTFQPLCKSAGLLYNDNDVLPQLE